MISDYLKLKEEDLLQGRVTNRLKVLKDNKGELASLLVTLNEAWGLEIVHSSFESIRIIKMKRIAKILHSLKRFEKVDVSTYLPLSPQDDVAVNQARLYSTLLDEFYVFLLGPSISISYKYQDLLLEKEEKGEINKDHLLDISNVKPFRKDSHESYSIGDQLLTKRELDS